MNYWMLSLTSAAFIATRDRNFSVQGFTRRQKRKTDRMEPGDRLLFYVKDWRGFPLTATLNSQTFEDSSHIWPSNRPEETYPYRVRIRAAVGLPDGQYLDALQIAPRMEYLRRWPPERWPLAFEEELHLLPRRDFEFIEGEMRRARRKTGRSRRRPSAAPSAPGAAAEGTAAPGR